jgi:hypothetical protein
MVYSKSSNKLSHGHPKKRSDKKGAAKSQASSGKKGKAKSQASSGKKGAAKPQASSGKKGKAKSQASSGKKGKAKSQASSGKKGKAKSQASSSKKGKAKSQASSGKKGKAKSQASSGKKGKAKSPASRKRSDKKDAAKPRAGKTGKVKKGNIQKQHASAALIKSIEKYMDIYNDERPVGGGHNFKASPLREFLLTMNDVEHLKRFPKKSLDVLCPQVSEKVERLDATHDSIVRGHFHDNEWDGRAGTGGVKSYHWYVVREGLLEALEACEVKNLSEAFDAIDGPKQWAIGMAGLPEYRARQEKLGEDAP